MRLRGAKRLGLGWLVAITGLAVAWAWSPASAEATVTWSSVAVGPQTLSPANVNASDVQVATDPAGDSIAVWLQSDPSAATRVAEAYRPAGGNFGLGQFISDNTHTAKSPEIAMNASGAAIAVWNESTFADPADTTLMHAIAGPGGSFGPATDSPTAPGDPDNSANDLTEVQVGIDNAGDALIAFERSIDPGGGWEVDVQFRPAGTASSFGPAYFISSDDGSQDNLNLAMNGAGDALVNWDQVPGDQSQYDRNYVASVFLGAGSFAGSHDPGNQFAAPEVVSDPSESDDVGPPVGALDANGNALVVFEKNPSGSSEVDVEAAYRPKATFQFNAAKTVGTYFTGDNDRPDLGFEGVATPRVAVDGSGNAFVIWGGATTADPSDAVSAPHTSDPLSVAYRPAGGDFGSPVQVASSGVGAPQLGVDGQGRQALLWESTDADGNVDVQAASRDGNSGAFTTPVTLTAAGATVDGSAPQLSLSAGGQAVAVWQTYDGAEDLEQATFGTPAPAPGAPTGPTQPPPPPPPPPPAVPAVITPAAAFQRGKAIVLTANVGSDVTQVRWTLPQGSSDVVGNVVGGHLQNSIRLHTTDKSFTVSVTAVGPGGPQSSTRTFQLLGQPTDTATEAVQRALTTAPKVFAVGDAPTLLGHTVCGALTVYSGKQQQSGCMRPVNAQSDIPDRELGAIQTMARSLGLDPSDPKLMTAAIQQIDGYVGVGQVMLDNKWPAIPSGGASLVSFPGIGALTSSNASLGVGGLKFGGLPSGFSLNVDPGKLDIPLGSLPKPQLPDIGGFPLVGDWNVDLGDVDATIDASLQLPSWLSIGGVPLHIPIRFKATPSGLVLDSLNVGPINANLGPLNVTNLKLTFDRPSDTWTGSGKVCLLTGVCLDMSPPNGEVKIVHGALNFAGATLGFPPPGVPLFVGVNLTKIGFGVGLDPTRLKASAGISVLDLVELDGELIAAFPTADHPFVLARDEVGPDFPADLYGKPFHEPTIGAAADVLVNLPVVGNVKLGSGYLLYEVPDFIALGGNEDFTIPHVMELGGSVAGAANFSDGTLNFNAEEHACLLLVGKICANAVVDVSKAPNDGGGAGGCVGVGPFHIGGGILWKGPKIVVWPFDGCKWSRFKVDVRPSIAAASVRTMVVHRGQPSPAMEIFGQGAAPLVRVTGPGGQVLDSTSSGFDHSPGGQIRILRYQGESEDFTVVGLEHAQPGTYTLTAMPGSVPFGTVESATDPPAAKISAHITGSGERRVLSYDIRKRPDQTVTFWDTNTGGAASRIGHVNGGGKGKLRFTAPPGDRRRKLYAQFSLNGLPAERIAVASYKPPAPTLRTPRHLRVARHTRRVTVGWNPVAGATAYEVTLTDPLTGYQRLARTHRHRLTLTAVARTVGGIVAVRAIEPKYSRESLTTSASVKRLASPPNSFRRLGHCRRSKKRLVCTGGPPARHKQARVGHKHKPKPTGHKHKPSRHR